MKPAFQRISTRGSEVSGRTFWSQNLASRWGIASLLASPLFFASCAIFTTRPVQELSDATAALKAAREAQAETLSPDLYRQANEWFGKAKREYKFKNFKEAKEYIETAKKLAEQAEFESIRQTTLGSAPPDSSHSPSFNTYDTPPPDTPSEPTEFPTPEGTPAESWDPEPPAPSPAPEPSPTS